MEIIDKTYERESRNYFHPLQYWLAKTGIDIFRLILYPLVFSQYALRTSRTPYFLRILFLVFCYFFPLFAWVLDNYVQLFSIELNMPIWVGTILALLSCLLSGFSPIKEDLGGLSFVTTFSFSRHVQHLLYRHETELYLLNTPNTTHLWYGPVFTVQHHYAFQDSENPYFWLFAMGIVLRLVTFVILYVKSEYRSSHRFVFTHAVPIVKSILCCEPCRRPKRKASILLNSTT